MLKLFDLIKDANWEDVSVSFLTLFQHEERFINKYEDVFQNLKKITPTDTDMILYLDFITKAEDCLYENSTNLYFKNGSMCEFNSECEEIFCLDFSPWSEWLGAGISNIVEEKYSKEDIISYCLYEMTSYGFNEEKIKEKLQDLNKKCQYAEEHPEKFILASEVFDNIRKKFNLAKDSEEE